MVALQALWLLNFHYGLVVGCVGASMSDVFVFNDKLIYMANNEKGKYVFGAKVDIYMYVKVKRLAVAAIWTPTCILFSWCSATELLQPPTLTILYMYCTGGTEMPGSSWELNLAT